LSVASFVASSIDTLHTGRYDVALSLACSAVDATSAKSASRYQATNSKRFKRFLEENMRVITMFGFPGIIAGGIQIKCRNFPNLKTDSDGYVSIADIIYHVVRCGLVHECLIDEHIEFTDQTYLGDFDCKFRIPRYLIFGLLMAVILSPSNAGEAFDRRYLEVIGGKSVNLQGLWAKGCDAFLRKHSK
jgi:hypothetical protein